MLPNTKQLGKSPVILSKPRLSALAPNLVFTTTEPPPEVKVDKLIPAPSVV